MTTTARAPLVELCNVRRTYRVGSEDVHALAGVDMQIQTGQFVAVVGPSGSGKSTLMHLLGFMDRPTSGRIFFEGQEVSGLSSAAQADYRARKLGFVFQSFNLLPRLTVVENVLLPIVYARSHQPDARARAMESLDRVGLANRAHHRPWQLSGGERQRAAIARALINHPRLILADEPTGNLDRHNVDRILELFRALHTEGQTIVLVTHDPMVASAAFQHIHMADGRVASDHHDN